MKPTLFFLLSILATVAWAHPEGHAGMVHLKFNNGKIHAHCTWQKGPAVGHSSILQIEWKNGANHTPLDPGGTVRVATEPPTSPAIDVKPALDEHGQPILGTELAGPIEFPKEGTWAVKVTLNAPNGAPETQTLKVNVPVSAATLQGK